MEPGSTLEPLPLEALLWTPQNSTTQIYLWSLDNPGNTIHSLYCYLLIPLTNFLCNSNKVITWEYWGTNCLTNKWTATYATGTAFWLVLKFAPQSSLLKFLIRVRNSTMCTWFYHRTQNTPYFGKLRIAISIVIKY